MWHMDDGSVWWMAARQRLATRPPNPGRSSGARIGRMSVRRAGDRAPSGRRRDANGQYPRQTRRPLASPSGRSWPRPRPGCRRIGDSTERSPDTPAARVVRHDDDRGVHPLIWRGLYRRDLPRSCHGRVPGKSPLAGHSRFVMRAYRVITVGALARSAPGPGRSSRPSCRRPSVPATPRRRTRSR